MFSAGRALVSKTTPVVLGRMMMRQQHHHPRYFAAAQTFLDASDVTDRILTVLKNFDQVDANKVKSEKVKFVDDLGLDSLDVVEVVMAIEDEFAIEIPDAEADKIASVGDAVEYITSHPMAK